MTVWSPSVVSHEISGTAQESFNDELGLMTASVQLLVDNAYRHALVASICGARLPWPKGAPAVVPLARTASIVPMETPGAYTGDETIDYGKSIVTINFTTEIVELASEEIEPTAEFQTLDHKWFRWGSGTGDHLREEEAPGRQHKGINYVRTDLDVAGPLSDSLIDLVGSVNSDTVVWSLLGFTSLPETLLYAPPLISYKIDSTNIIKYTVTKRFSYNPNGWNRYYRSKTATFDQIYVAGAGSPYENYPPETFGGVLL